MAQLPPQLFPLLVVACLSFPLLGAVQALLGPYFSVFMQHYHVEQAEVSQVVSSQFTGIALGMISSIAALKYLKARKTLLLSALLLLAGLLGMAYSPTWSLLLGCAFVFGVAYGVHASCINTLLSQYGVAAAPVLNGVNATFGVGSLLGPQLIRLFESYGLPFLVLGVLAVVVFVLSLRVQEQTLPPRPKMATAGTLIAVLACFSLSSFAYVSAEVAPSNWMVTHLTGVFSPFWVGLAPSLYWGALALGRLVFAPVSRMVKPSVLVILAALGATLMLLGTHNTALALYFYPLAGFLPPHIPPCWPGSERSSRNAARSSHPLSAWWGHLAPW
ncbi:MFS transporter [Deinococcus roseus]|uniref:Major facilitator superfamily (MFS) profile domain-containing protein n=1 Tax=Deinococcus roseus TaxID=392414 RepID=A0ABQ2CTZ6_9DEIO|nr:MFS transporter [Deinococcus roseus]GGJ20717.1 hypothetical protein GCM10008938_03690 [Deinococcus roseus]